MSPNLFGLTWLWKAIAGLLIFLWAATVAGCTVTTKNDGAMWIKFSQGVEIGHRAAKTSDQAATAGINGKALVNHIVELRDPAKDGGDEG